jgi:hypothetical protein
MLRQPGCQAQATEPRWRVIEVGRRPDRVRASGLLGGTALEKVYFGDYRFSEDLDFSAVGAPTAEALEAELRQAVAIARQMACANAEIELELERYVERDAHPGPSVPTSLETVSPDIVVPMGGEWSPTRAEATQRSRTNDRRREGRSRTA